MKLVLCILIILILAGGACMALGSTNVAEKGIPHQFYYLGHQAAAFNGNKIIITNGDLATDLLNQTNVSVRLINNTTTNYDRAMLNLGMAEGKIQFIANPYELDSGLSLKAFRVIQVGATIDYGYYAVKIIPSLIFPI